MTPNFKVTAPALLLLLVIALLLLGACSSTPTVAPMLQVPPLPPQFKQSLETTPSECLPTCLDGLTRLRESLQELLKNAGSAPQAASSPTR